MYKLNRRQFLAGSSTLLGAGALGLAGCGPDSSNEGSSTGKGKTTTLQFAWWGNPERDKRTNTAIKAYQKKNTNTTIRAQITNWGDYWTKLATQVAGGKPPDLIQMDYAYITEYANRGTLLALDDYVPDKLHIDDFDDRSLKSGTVNGKLYGATMGINSMAMLYNDTLIKSAGLELPGNEMTWSEYADFAKKLAAATPDKVYGTPNGMLSDVPFECWLRSRGKALYTADGKLGFQPADMEEWFTFWMDLANGKVVPPPEVEIEGTGDIADALIVKSQAGFSFNWSNQLAAFNTASKDTVKIHMYPQGDGPDAKPGQFYKASMLLSVAAKSKNPEEAVTLANGLLADPQFAKELGFERGVPPSKSVRDALLADATEDDKATAAFIEEIADKIGDTPPPPPQGATEVETAFTYSVEQTAYKKLSIADSVDKFFADANKALGG